jgi:hypothetical protein
MDSVLVKRQRRKLGPKVYTENGETYRIIANVRHDDECGNGHNSFSVTGEIERKQGSRWVEDSGGCIHDEVAKHFPELAHLIKWHLSSTDGPMHYVANTVYLAGDRDHNGLKAGETRGMVKRDGSRIYEWRTDDGMKPYELRDTSGGVDSVTFHLVQRVRVGEGKERQLDAARRSAVWPDATDEELTAPDLKERLEERLAALLADFRADVEAFGLEW